MSNYSIFSVLGIEIEYMLVDKHSLNVQPKSDILLKALAGALVNEVALGEISASNELVMHVLELKNNGPKPVNPDVAEHFQKTIALIQPLLAENDLILLPTGAHPWMNPIEETQRWPYGNKAIYQQYDTIFNCKGHGWANLQSMHVNLPFANDEEFFHLHSVIRLLLPLIPALAASTPLLDGKKTGMTDSRLYFYEKNQQAIPQITGNVIPEFVRSPKEYEEIILQPMYAAISPHDPQKILQYEWLNSRAAIAKFDSQCIEIRIIDSQENVNSDIAIAHLIHAILKNWHESSDYHLKNPCNTAVLKQVYEQTIQKGLLAEITNPELMLQWQLPKRSMLVRDIWSHLIERVSSSLSSTSQMALENILLHGNLSDRIVKGCHGNFEHSSIKRVYEQLARCLLTNQPYIPV